MDDSDENAISTGSFSSRYLLEIDCNIVHQEFHVMVLKASTSLNLT